MDHAEKSIAREMPNGGGGAAVISAGLGAFALAVLAILGDQIPRFKQSMIFYRPTGPLSGVTTIAIALWLITWSILHVRWRNRTIAIGRISAVALVLLCLSVLLTFPPLADLF